MKKIIVVGHPESNIESVGQLLVNAGMVDAKPSRREGLRPQEINATLLKAHGAVPVESVQSAEQLQQIQVAPVWQGMVLDLMLGNLGSPVWGWVDPQAIYLLDYWKGLDPEIVFVLVYDAPHSALTRLSLEEAGASEQELQRRLDAWVAYNSALLHFHLRNPGRSVLVHVGQTKPLVRRHLQYLSERIDLPLQFSGQDALVVAPASDTASALLEDAQVALLAGMLIQVNPEAQSLYAQLQAASTVPSSARPQELISLADPANADLHYRAWRACVAQQQNIQHLSQRVQEVSAQSALLQEQVSQTHEKLENAHQSAQAQKAQYEHQLQLAQQTAQAQLEEQARRTADLQKQVQENAQEKNDLLEQLHRSLEELKCAHLNEKKEKEKNLGLQQDNESLRAHLNKMQVEIEEVRLKNKKYAADVETAKSGLKEKTKKLEGVEAELTRQKHLAQEMQRKGQEEKNKTLELQQENDLLLAQLRQVQEEFGDVLSRNKDQQYRLEQLQQELEANEKPENEIYYGAAERIKRGLSYRLGACMLAQPRTLYGWLKMPFALRAEVRSFYQSDAAIEGDSLPPLAQYADAHEADAIKQHLPYRLGSSLLARSRVLLLGWLRMPDHLRAELKDFQRKCD